MLPDPIDRERINVGFQNRCLPKCGSPFTRSMKTSCVISWVSSSEKWIILPLHQMKNVIIEPLVENSPRSLVPVRTWVDNVCSSANSTLWAMFSVIMNFPGSGGNRHSVRPGSPIVYRATVILQDETLFLSQVSLFAFPGAPSRLPSYIKHGYRLLCRKNRKSASPGYSPPYNIIILFCRAFNAL